MANKRDYGWIDQHTRVGNSKQPPYGSRKDPGGKGAENRHGFGRNPKQSGRKMTSVPRNPQMIADHRRMRNVSPRMTTLRRAVKIGAVNDRAVTLASGAMLRPAKNAAIARKLRTALSP